MQDAGVPSKDPLDAVDLTSLISAELEPDRQVGCLALVIAPRKSPLTWAEGGGWAHVQRSTARYAFALITADGVHYLATESADEQVRRLGPSPRMMPCVPCAH